MKFNSAIQLDLLECRPGAEDKLFASLRPSAKGMDQLVYKCLGRYDFLSVKSVPRLDIFQPALQQQGIRARTNQFAFGWQGSDYVTTRLADQPAAVLTMLKLNQALRLFASDLIPGQDQGLSLIAQIISEQSVDASLYYTFGNHQLLLFNTGDNLETLLKKVSEIRALKMDELGITDYNLSQVPIIDNSITIPLVRYDEKGRLRSAELRGSVRPMVFLGAAPGAESDLASFWEENAACVDEVFGRSDLVAFWRDQGIPTEQFINLVVAQRQQAKNRKGPAFTSTILLRSDKVTTGGMKSVSMVADDAEILSRLGAAEEALKKTPIQTDGDETFRGNALSLLGLLYTALTDRTSTDFVNLDRFAMVFADRVRRFCEDPDHVDEKHSLVQMMDSALSALTQQAPGSMLDSLSSDSLATHTRMGFSTALSAASYVAEFIHFCCNDHLPTTLEKWKGNWTGFIIFESTFGPTASQGEVIKLPRDWLYRPIRKWWSISHEVWHTLYYRKFEEQNDFIFRELALRLAESSFDEIRQLVSELFANWMDYYYCFEDNALFCSLVWPHWLQVPPLKESPKFYFLRSFMIHLYANNAMKSLQEKTDISPAEASIFLTEHWQSYRDFLTSLVPATEDLFLRLTEADLKRIITIAIATQGIIHWFDENLAFKELRNTMQYSAHNIELQIEQLLKGVVPNTPIDNPVRILLALAKKTLGDGVSLSPLATAALLEALARGNRDLKNLIEERGLSKLVVS